MPYTDDPVNNLSDRVRFLVGDTDAAHPDLTDNEVGYLLSEEGGNPVRAAARAAETMAAKFTKISEEKRVGPLLLRSFSDRANRYLRLARRLWSRAATEGSAPYAGGLSLAEKNAVRADDDRVKPAFSRRMMEYPKGSPNQSTPEELLS